MITFIRNTLRSWRWWGAALFVVMCVVAVVAITWDIATGGGDHTTATLETEPSTSIEVCPEAHDAFDALREAQLDYATEFPAIAVLPLGESNCSGPVVPGVARVRPMGTSEPGFEFRDEEGYFDVVGTDGDLRVIYWTAPSVDRPDYLAHHVYGHALGLGHTTAAGSWMHGCEAWQDVTSPECQPGSQPTWMGL